MRPFLTLHHPSRAKHFYEQGSWQAETFYALLTKHATLRPDALALQDGRQSLTWTQLRSWVDGVGADLRSQGLVAGDCVSIWMSNKVEAIVTFLACSREGYVCNPSLHRTYTFAEIHRLLERVSSRALLTEDGWGADRRGTRVDEFRSRLEATVVYRLDEFPRPGPNRSTPSTDPDRVAYLAFTSGTTGAPKCVMHSENTLLANARDIVRDWRLGPDTILLTLSPLSHHFAWGAVAQSLVAGARLVTDDRAETTSRLRWIEGTGATFVVGVPTHAIDVLTEQRQSGMARLGRVGVFCMGGAPIPPSVAHAFIKQGIRPLNVYGMTENSSHQYTLPDDDEDTIVSTCGHASRAYEIRLFDPSDTDRTVSPGEIGEIGGRGPSLMLGYFGDQSATERSFNREGFFMSGDLGRVDAKGNLRIEGRAKDVIIRGGHNIQPSHIEALALRHAQVRGAACFPVPDDRLGEKVGIAIVGDIEPDELLGHLASLGLSKYDMPEYLITLEEFPMTASGKVLKRELIDKVRRGELSPRAISMNRERRSN